MPGVATLGFTRDGEGNFAECGEVDFAEFGEMNFAVAGEVVPGPSVKGGALSSSLSDSLLLELAARSLRDNGGRSVS